MKKIILVYITVLITVFSVSTLRAQTPAYKGIYIDSFDGIVGNTLKEDSLLHYLQDSSFNSIICYRMSSVISATLSNSKNTLLANFLKKARTQYGIKNVMASSECYDTFKSLIAPYNRSRADSNERFNYYYLEFEFWNVHSTSPVSSANNGYYCTTYLSPKGYNCDTTGAFLYYRKMLKSLDSLAYVDGIRSATYVGNPNQGQCKFIANTVDLLLCDNYTSSINNVYTDVKTLFSYFGSTSKKLKIVPIFASYSPGGNFLGDWLTQAPVGPHTEKGVYNNYFLPKYNAETGAWKAKLDLVGYQWYRYSGMPHNGNYSAGNFCTAPSNLSATAINSTTATINWTGISGGLGYVVQYRSMGSTAWSNPIACTGTSLNISSLSSATTYEFQVKSSCISSTSAFSASSSFTTPGVTGCGIASGLTANAITDIAATLSWSSIVGANGYSIQYRKIGASAWISGTSSSASFALSALTASSIYEFQVKTNCANGSSTFSTSYLFSTLAPVCNAPVGLSISTLTSNSVTLKWTSISGVTGYNVQYRKLGTTAWTSTTSTSSSKSILALTESTNYEFQVQTKCSATNASSFSTSYLFTTLANTCGTPTNIAASAATTNSFTITWTANPSASSYKVQYRKTSATTWTSVTTTSNSKNIASLSTATAYEYQVATVCSNGTSNYSAIGTISTLSNASTCGVPSGLFVTNITLTSLTLNWNPVPGASSYKIQYRISGTTNWSTKTTSFTNKSITSLAANTSYEFQVQTVCSSGNSSFSASSFFDTTPPAITARMASPASGVTLNKVNDPAAAIESSGNLLNSEKLTVFPNPTDKENINVRIQLSKKDLVMLEVYDMLGNKVISETILTDENGFAESKISATAQLKVGIYQIVAHSSNKKFVSKLVLR